MLASFIPMDRRQALARAQTLPTQTTGAALLSDLASYTALTAAFVAAAGPQAGGEAFFRALAPLFARQIEVVHAHGGSVLGFSGDALTCWFDGDSGGRAVAAAYALQAACAALPPLALPDGTGQVLGLKVVVASGEARRFLVGDPALGLLDVLAGAPLARLGVGEHLAGPGEILLDATSAAAVGVRGLARRAVDEEEAGPFLPAPRNPDPATLLLAPPTRWPPLAPGVLSESQLAPWVPPTVRARLQAADPFQVELRPAVALFLHFDGIDYSRPTAPARLDAYIRAVQAVLAQYGGTLLTLTVGEKGNYCYASFGAPVAYEDAAARAAAAALALRSAPAACPYIRGVQIGLASGPVYAGPYGSLAAQTYGARGDSVNLAARLMQAAGPGSILATRDVRRATGGRFAWTTLPPLLVKGKAAPVPVDGLQAAREFDLAAPPASTPLVDRTDELAALAAAGATARAGRGQVVGLVGEAGLGKSRLVAAAVAQARAAGFAVYGGAARSTGTQIAYLAWQPLWLSFFDLDPSAPPAEQIGELEHRLADLDAALLPRLPLLSPVLGLTLPDTDLTAGMEPKLRKASLEGLLVAALRIRALGGPLLLVLEDAHWLDPAGQDLLEALARAIPALPVLLVLAYRPPDPEVAALARLAALPHFTTLALRPLAGDAAVTLARAIVAATGRTVSAPGVAALVARAEGNPFYLEELVAYLAGQGIDLSAPAALAGVSWPESLQSLLLARIDATSERQRTLLKVASIVGRRFPVVQLWGVYPDLGPEPAVAADLGVLDGLGLTPLESRQPEWVHMFRHAVTHEVTYGSLPAATRARLHGQFASWLEAGSGADAPASLDLLAFHYARSDREAKAREYLRRAGDAAAKAGAPAAAADYYRDLLARLEPTAAERAAVLVALGDALEQHSDVAAAAVYYRQVLALDAPDSAPAPPAESALRGAAARGLAMTRARLGAFAEAVAWLEQARATYAAVDDILGEARVLSDLGRVHAVCGAYAQARAALEASQARATGAAAAAIAVQVQHTLGQLGEITGDLAAGRTHFAASLALARERGDRWAATRALISLGNVEAMAGDVETARAHYDESLALAHHLGDRWGAARALNNLGILACGREADDESQALFAAGLALWQELANPAGIATSRTGLATLATLHGDYATAQALYRECLALWQEMGQTGEVAWTQAALGYVLHANGDTPAGRVLLADAVRACPALGPIPNARDILLYAAVLLAPDPVAATLLGVVRGLLETQGTQLLRLEQEIYTQVEAAMRRALGDAAFLAARAAGQALPWDAALAAAQDALSPLAL